MTTIQIPEALAADFLRNINWTRPQPHPTVEQMLVTIETQLPKQAIVGTHLRKGNGRKMLLLSIDRDSCVAVLQGVAKGELVAIPLENLDQYQVVE